MAKETGNPRAPKTAREVILKEQAYIAKRRAAAKEIDPKGNYPTTNIEEETHLPELKGLALSGGGIRSATFCMGFMQALARKNKLIHFDYLSAVSGGSWIATSLSWFLSQANRQAKTWQDKETVLDYGLGPENFPFNNKKKAFTPCSTTPKETRNILRGRNLVSWIRSRAKVVTPGFGFGMSALIGMILRSMIINLVIFVPVIIALFVLTRIYVFSHAWAKQACSWLPSALSKRWPLQQCIDWYQNDFYWALPVIIFVIFVTTTVLYAVISRFSVWLYSFVYRPGSRRYMLNARNFYTKSVGYGLMLLIGFSLLATFPPLHDLLIGFLEDGTTSEKIISVITALVGVAATLLGRNNGEKQTPGFFDKLRPYLLNGGCALLLYAVMFTLYIVAIDIMIIDIKIIFTDDLKQTGITGLTEVVGATAGNQSATRLSLPTWALISLGLSLTLGFIANINHNSIHRFYRDRLLMAFLPDPEYIKKKMKFADDFRLSEMQAIEEHTTTSLLKTFSYKVYPGNSIAPYLLINACLTTTDSPDRKLRGRGFSHFLLSSFFVGSDGTGYRETKDYMFNRMTLATAMAISGAAADPNTYVTRSRALSFLMSLLNLRLGFWAPNPNPELWHENQTRVVPAWYSALLREMLGKGLNETTGFIHLSDGGHAENLGVYELIRRRCKTIVAVDAAADRDWKWGDLGRLIEQVRVDFGVDIHFDPQDIDAVTPKREAGEPYAKSARAYLVADIIYPPLQNRNAKGANTGKLILVKTTIPQGIKSADIHAYKRANTDFPDQTTADQFFDEVQFEAYRRLGFEIGCMLCNDKAIQKHL